MKQFCLFLLIVCTISCKHVKAEKEPNKITYSNSILLEQFKYTEGIQPLVSVHRGGKGIINYPENCLETLKFISDSINAVYEVDVAQTKDGILVLMHDNSIDRTTNGSGLIIKKTNEQLQNYYLIDDFDNQTNFKIPEFDAVLKWAKNNKVILTIDIKKSVDVKDVIEAVRRGNAQDISIIITYDLEQSLRVYQLAPELMQSVSARNQIEFDGLLASGIPSKNMLAFTGTRLSSDSLYSNIHAEGIRTILGTLGNLDNQAAARGDYLYSKWKEKGIDIFATDRPFEVAKTIKQ